MDMNINISRTITRQMIEDVFVCAIEGGSNYWYTLSEYAVDKIRSVVSQQQQPWISVAIIDAILDHDVDIPINDVENPDDVLGVISKSTMNERIQSLSDSKSYSWALDDMFDESLDAASADIIFQYIVLGHVDFA